MKKIIAVLIVCTLIFMMFACTDNVSVNEGKNENGNISEENDIENDKVSESVEQPLCYVAEAGLLLPYMAEKNLFEEKILTPIRENGTNAVYSQIQAAYILKDFNDPELTDLEQRELIAEYPILAQVPAIYLFDPYLPMEKLIETEELIKEYTGVTFADIEQLHISAGMFCCQTNKGG